MGSFDLAVGLSQASLTSVFAGMYGILRTQVFSGNFRTAVLTVSWAVMIAGKETFEADTNLTLL